jgi:hypothetical protein
LKGRASRRDACAEIGRSRPLEHPRPASILTRRLCTLVVHHSLEKGETMRALWFSLTLALISSTAACGKGAAAAKELDELAKRVCACKDLDCAKKGEADIDAWMKKNADTKGTEEDAKKITAAVSEAMDCLTKLNAAATPPPTPAGDKPAAAPEGDKPADPK